MKLRDILNQVKNKNNSQINWSPKKRMLKQWEISEEDILDMEITKLNKKCFK